MTAVRTTSAAPAVASGTDGPTTPYRGQDRRASTPPAGASPTLLVATGLLGGLLVPAVLFRDVADPAVVDVQRALLLGVSCLVAGLTGVLCLLRLRVTGEAPLVWLAAALLVLAASRLGGLVDVAADPGRELRAASAVYGAGTLLGLVLVARALRSPPVDTRLRAGPVLAGAALATALVAGALRAAGLDEPLGDLLSAEGAGRALGVGVAVAWLGVVAQATHRSRQAGGTVVTWPALTALGLALAGLVPVLARAVGGDPARASLLVEAGAMVCALVGIQSSLVRTVGDQQAVLFDTQVEAATTAARERAGQQAREERDHDLRSALFAIEGAARTLERHQAALDDASRHALARAVASEVARLQDLVRQADDGAARVAFPVVDVLTPLLALELTAGVDLRVEVPEGLTALGSPAATTEILRNLLDNARTHAPGAAVSVSAEQRDGEVVLHVADEGPGVPEPERSTVFERGVRGARAAGTVEGSGLGLFVSARLAARQGGRLELDDGGGRGARFRLRLPRPTGAEAS